MPFGGSTLAWNHQVNHVSGSIHMGATWRIRLNELCPTAWRAVATTAVAILVMYILCSKRPHFIYTVIILDIGI